MCRDSFTTFYTCLIDNNRNILEKLDNFLNFFSKPVVCDRLPVLPMSLMSSFPGVSGHKLYQINCFQVLFLLFITNLNNFLIPLKKNWRSIFVLLTLRHPSSWYCHKVGRPIKTHMSDQFVWSFEQINILSTSNLSI